MCGTELRPLDDDNLFQSMATLFELVGHSRNMGSSMERAISTVQLTQFLSLISLRAMYKENAASRGRSNSIFSKEAKVFLYLLEFTKDLRATDPRDKLFALLSLSDFNLTPDYSVSATETFLSYARCAIKERCLKIIDRAGVGVAPNSSDYEPKSDLDTLPSWVPDWALISCTKPLPYLALELRAFPHVPEEINLEVKGRVLSWPAVVLDKITEVGEDATETTEWQLVERERKKNTLLEAYPSGISRLHALVLLRVAGIDFDNARTKGRMEVPSDQLYAFTTLFFDRLSKQSKETDFSQGGGMMSLAWNFFAGLGFSVETAEEKKMQRLMYIQPGETPPNDWKATRDKFRKHNVQESYTQINKALSGWLVFHAQQGYLGYCPPGTKENDLICLLQGYQYPVTLRKVDEHYVLVGRSYVVDLMYGEVVDMLKNGKVELTQVEIH